MSKSSFYYVSVILSLLFYIKALGQTPVYSTPYTVTTLAGTATQGTGYLDATGPNAYFSQPYGIAVDSTGNIYVADSGNFVVRKVTASGVVTTIAGQAGQLGSVDGSATSAKFGFIRGITTDLAGNIYVTDTTYNTVRKISPSSGTWIVSTIVSSAAGLNNPLAIAYDTYSGNLFVSDAGNYVIRKITNSGIMSTFAGTLGSLGGIDGVPGKATFGSPSGIAADGNGNIYCVDSPDSTLRKISSLGTASTVGGYIGAIGLLDGPLNNTTAQFSQPYGLAIDSKGNIYITDQANLTVIRQVTSSGIVSTLAGAVGSAGRADGTGANANFNQPHGLAVDPNGIIYVADTYSSTIRKLVSASSTPIPIPVLATAAITGTVGTSINAYTLFATNSPTNFALANGSQLPAGINLNNTSGLLTGTPTLSGVFQVYITATNTSGTSTPTLITFTINAATSTIPSISTQPLTQTVNPGSYVTLSVTASGTAPSYQWYLNGVAISGATSSTYTIPSALQVNAGSYTVSITNSSGAVTSQAAQLNVLNPGRLSNLSVLSLDGPGTQLLTVGFVSGGSGTTGSQNLLIRASGPAIGAAPYNVPNVLPDPTLTVYSSTISVASNDNWNTPTSNGMAVTAADAATGAFTLTNTSSLDAALVTSLKPGGYSVQVAGKNGASGNVIAEVYDNTPADSYTINTPRLVNLSCLEQVASGGILSTGFVIGGTTSEQVLIRASGPTLAAAPFNIPGTIPDPKVTVFNSSSAILATNTGWGGSAAITAANTSTGAFQFANSTSKDSAVLITLQPGAYTVQATSVSGTAGVTLIEVYEVSQ